MRWHDITYRQLLQLQELGENATETDILRVLYPGKTLGEIPGDWDQFLNEEMKPEKPKAVLNWGHRYSVSLNFAKYSVEQYSDFQAMVTNDRTAAEVLATLIVPECGYGELDLDEVLQDIMSAPCTEVIGLVNFTTAECERLLRNSLLCSAAEIVKNKEIPWKQRRKLLWATCKCIVQR